MDLDQGFERIWKIRHNLQGRVDGSGKKVQPEQASGELLPCLPSPSPAVWSQEVLEAQTLENIAAEAGLDVSHPKSCLVPE